MAATQAIPRHSALPVLSWLGGRVPKAYLRIERSHNKLATVVRTEDSIDDENVLSAGDALREADLEATRSAGDTDIFVRGEEERSQSNDANSADRRDDDPSEASGPCAREMLESLSIDDLRELAYTLQVHDRSRITDKEELIDEICKRF